MSIEIPTAAAFPPPVPAQTGTGVEVRTSKDDVVLARVALVSLGGFAVAVLLLLGFGIAVIS